MEGSRRSFVDELWTISDAIHAFNVRFIRAVGKIEND